MLLKIKNACFEIEAIAILRFPRSSAAVQKRSQGLYLNYTTLLEYSLMDEGGNQ